LSAQVVETLRQSVNQPRPPTGSYEVAPIFRPLAG